MKAATSKTTQTVSCPKCDGSGHIQAFGHVANGVCFCCKGVGTIEVGTDSQKAELSEDTRRKADWIMQSTEASYAGLSYAKLEKIRNFAYSGFGLDQAYPELLAHYREVGEPAFFAAQERKLEAFYANRN